MADEKPKNRRGPAWQDERQTERGDQRVMQGFAALRAERVYAEATDCGDCLAERAQGDPDGLCERHLAEALGMHSEWDVPR